MSHAEDAAQILQSAGERMITEVSALCNEAAIKCDEIQAMVNQAIGGTEAASESAALVAGVIQRADEASAFAAMTGMQFQDLANRFGR